MKKIGFLALAALVSLTVTSCGKNGGTTGPLTWKISDNGVLTISGTGAMPNYTLPEYGPWFSLRETIDTVVIEEGVTHIGDYAFNGCSTLAGITLPASLTGIGSYVFYGCSALTGVNIPSSVSDIGDYAFQDCSALTSVNIPSRETGIGMGTFYNCSALTGIDIPNSVTRIYDYAFAGCSNLKNIVIPEGVTIIGNAAFAVCPELAAVVCLATVPPSLGNTNFLVKSGDVLFVPAESLEAYRGDSVWSGSFTTIAAIQEQTL